MGRLKAMIEIGIIIAAKTLHVCALLRLLTFAIISEENTTIRTREIATIQLNATIPEKRASK